MALLPNASNAQILSLQGGAVSQQLVDRRTAYEVEYLQRLPDGFDVSVGYINEGHFSSPSGTSHRDGYPLEFWYEIPLDKPMGLSLLVGAGPYLWFDTETPSGRASKDAHDVAPMGSVSLSEKVSNRWFLFATAERIQAIGDFKSNLFLVGGGVWLSGNGKGAMQALPDEDANASPHSLLDEITFSPVLSVINISGNPRSIGAAVEYRHRWQKHMETTATYIYEGDPRVIRRSGIAAQIWPERSTLGGRVELGVGAGAYAFIDKRNLGNNQKNPATFAPLLSVMATFNLSNSAFLRAVWDRVLTRDSHDADIARLGVGYRF